MGKRGRKASRESILKALGIEPGTEKEYRCIKCKREWNMAGLFSGEEERRKKGPWWRCPYGCNAELEKLRTPSRSSGQVQ